MTDTVLGFGALGLLGAALWFAVRQMRQNVAEREAEYWRQECALLEYENRFLHGLEQRLIPRLLQQFGADFQDYMIGRTLRQHSGIGAGQPEPRRKMVIQTYHPGHKTKGIDITAGNFVRRADDGEDGWDDETENTVCRPAAAHGRSFGQSGSHQPRQSAMQRPYTPHFGVKPQLQAPIRSIRSLPHPVWQGDDDVIDAEFTEIPALPYLQQPENSAPQIRKGGRPKKYATAAERQAAYRARRAA